MDSFYRAILMVIICGILYTVLLSGQQKEFAGILALCACAMICAVALGFLRPVLEFFSSLQDRIGWNREMIGVLLRATGIGLLGQLASLVCAESGSASLSKAVQILSSAAILWLSMPVFQSLLDLISQIAGSL